MTAEFPDPELQVAFAIRLEQIEQELLHGALADAVTRVGVAQIDQELARFAPSDTLTVLAADGLRGELFFPCPSLLQAKPTLVGYYRLLFGYSQKEFYGSGSSRQKFKRMEEGSPTRRQLTAQQLDEFCTAASRVAVILIASMPTVTLGRVRDLQMLTLGPQLRGGRLNAVGRAAQEIVFRRIQAAIHPSAVERVSPTSITLRNASGRIVRVEFASDPDIAITEELSASDSKRLAIEIKGGADYSNIHNRLGEAEKSHLKAKSDGFAEFWTIVNVAIDESAARKDSPTTNQFFNLTRIVDPADDEWIRFRDELTSRLGVPAAV